MSNEEIAELAKEVDKRFKRLEEKVLGNGKTGSVNGKSTEESTGRNEVPVYKCDKSGCTFATDSEVHMMRHIAQEEAEARKPTPEKELTEEPKRHKTVDDFLNCPECFPKFEKAFLDRGYTKPQENPAETEPKKKKRWLP